MQLAPERPDSDELPRWDVTGLHPGVTSRSFVDAVERMGADVDRAVALFDELDVRAVPPRLPDADDGSRADRAIGVWNDASDHMRTLQSYVHAAVATDSRDAAAQAAMSELAAIGARFTPLLGRLAEWVAALGVDALGAVSTTAREHHGPLLRLAARREHQMSEAEEHLYAELATTGSDAWRRLQRDLTSQLTAEVAAPGGTRHLPMTAVRGLATDADPAVRKAAYDAERAAWPTIEVAVAAAMNSIKGEATAVDRRRSWATPLDASLFANSVARETFEAMQSAVVAALPDLRRWMRVKAALHGHRDGDGLPWWDLVAPLPTHSGSEDPGTVSWQDGIDVVRDAFGRYGADLAGLVDRAVDERWIDVGPRDGKTGGAFCMPFVDDRSLVLLNWSGSADAVQTTAHELGHAYHNTTLAPRTALQRRLPMALAETASIFCETLVVEAGLERATGAERLRLLDVDLQGTNQVIVDIHSRFLFETEVFTRRSRRTLAAGELCELMTDAQAIAYGDGLDQSTAHPHMWLLKPHYYGSHFYNWPYTFGLLFGLGLFARYREDPERFRSGYADLLSRAGMDTAEELAAQFGIDVTDEAFWTASLDVVRGRIDDYQRLAAEH
jgi:pepF/M3 family oligoendopeptidase